MIKILGIETSCDETAAAVVTSEHAILSNIVLSQIQIHEVYGGVVPEIGARAHLKTVEQVVHQALREANLSLADIDGIAVTGGPGLIGGVLVGTMVGKGLSASLGRPFMAINHLEGHALTPRLTHGLDYPYLLLLASGGHCQFLEVKGLGDYHLYGATLDDAAGEAFDKVARMMGLPYPGGPEIEKLAEGGDPFRFDLPRPLLNRPGCDFSFAGLKTAVRRILEQEPSMNFAARQDLAASFQQAVGDCFVNRAQNALKLSSSPCLVVSGGVAANKKLRQRLQTLAQDHSLSFVAPPLKLCTDNAAMIAWVGVERYLNNNFDNLDFKPRPRWPLAERNNR